MLRAVPRSIAFPIFLAHSTLCLRHWFDKQHERRAIRHTLAYCLMVDSGDEAVATSIRNIWNSMKCIRQLCGSSVVFDGLWWSLKFLRTLWVSTIHFGGLYDLWGYYQAVWWSICSSAGSIMFTKLTKVLCGSIEVYKSILYQMELCYELLT
ncbi:hypothetical protein B0H19DRAFT_1203127 [Mycena capillaripes]|nr:hypothetical protein B0H19DRAFT_1203127 [Mycena capillaripes]